jgi:hypothetical protein
MLTTEQYATWKGSMSPDRQHWLSCHPDAEEMFLAFGDQGFEDAWTTIELTLPVSCTSGKCDHRLDGQGCGPRPSQ